MKKIDRRYKTILQTLSAHLQEDLLDKIPDNRLIKIDKIEVAPSKTYGYVVDIFRFKKLQGTIQIWLDLFANVNRPIISICYVNGNIERIKELANASTPYIRNKADYDYSMVQEERTGVTLEKPLPSSSFGKFVIETYDSNFFTYYFPDEIRVEGELSREFERRVLKKLEWLIRATISTLANQPLTSDEQEQDKIFRELQKRKYSKIDILNELLNSEIKKPKIVFTNSTSFKRENKIIGLIKFLRDPVCQLCGTFILKRNEMPYIEAAHITPKHLKGFETLDNIILLCPNHHKEFDLGDRKIINRTKSSIELILNGKKYSVQLIPILKEK